VGEDKGQPALRQASIGINLNRLARTQLPFAGMFAEDFIENRRQGLEVFVNK